MKKRGVLCGARESMRVLIIAASLCWSVTHPPTFAEDAGGATNASALTPISGLPRPTQPGIHGEAAAHRSFAEALNVANAGGAPALNAAPVAASPARNPRIAVIGDFGRATSGYMQVRDVAKLVRSRRPDIIITTGDNNYECGDASTIDHNIGQFFHDYIHPYVGTYGRGASTNRFFPTLGNHDWGCGTDARIDPHLNYFTLPGNERYYDFVLGPVHFFALDSDPREPDGVTEKSVQASWLRNRLAASTAPWKLVYFHHNPYSSAIDPTGKVDAPWMRWPFQAWGATAVLTGHAHVYERLVRDKGFPYFVNGLGGGGIHLFGPPVEGSQVRFNAEYGAMFISASASSLYFEFTTVKGLVIDTYTISARVPATSDVPPDTVLAYAHGRSDARDEESAIGLDAGAGAGSGSFLDIAEVDGTGMAGPDTVAVSFPIRDDFSGPKGGRASVRTDRGRKVIRAGNGCCQWRIRIAVTQGVMSSGRAPPAEA